MRDSCYIFMKDFDRLRVRFREFGGWRLVVQYARMGVLWVGIREIVRCALTGRSMKAVYPKVTQRVDEILYRSLSPILSCKEGEVQTEGIGRMVTPSAGEEEAIIWFCWLQGLEEAPEMVHACLRSLQSLPDARVQVIDRENYRDYIEFPDYVLEKYRKGYIPHANMSDMLRLALLARHGGVWIDATVLATYREEHAGFWKSILESEFYLYRYFRNGRVNGISNWFLAAKPGNIIVNDVLQLLYAYWKKYDCVVDYYMMHLFIGWSAKRHPEYVRKMPKGNSYHAVMLGGALEKRYDRDSWNNLTEHVLFHKMTYRHTAKAKAKKESYYNYIIERYS